MVGSVADSSTSGGSFWFERHVKKTQCSKLVMSFVKGADIQYSPNSGNGTVIFVG
jgi:hypothetical protein